jgi:hypothetical protein
VIYLVATRFGSGITSDSMAYLAAGETWLMGLGIGRLSGPDGFKPMTHFPPLFPLLLTGGQLLGTTGIQAARWINAVFHGGTILLVGLVVSQLSRNTWASLLGAATVLLSPVILTVNSRVMSEPAYLFLGLLGLWFLSRWQVEGHRWRLVLAGISIGLAYLTRYAGISLVVSALACLFLTRNRTMRSKVKASVVFLLVSLPSILVWMARNAAWTGSVTNRRWIWHPPPPSYFGASLRLVWSWVSTLGFGSHRRDAYAGLVLLAAALGLIIWVLWESRKRDPGSFTKSTKDLLLHPVVLYAPIYLGLILISRFFMDATTPLDNRIASPIYLTLLIFLASIFPSLWRALSGKPGIRIALICGVVLLMVSYGIRVAHETGEHAAEQRGGLASAWRQGPVREIWDLPPETVIYTDDLERLYYFYGRGGYQVQREVDSVTGLPRSDYDSQLAEVRRALDSGDAVLFLFVSESTAASKFPEITAGLEPVVSTSSGTLYLGPYDGGS